MDGKKDLQKSSSSTLSLVEISRPKDLLKAQPIFIQVREHGEMEVLRHIRISVEKCAASLGISMSDVQVETLCLDLLEVYKYDSIEDIQQCLKKARQGDYGFGHNSRSILTMILIREWMELHLREKSRARETRLSKLKDQFQETLAQVDYQAYKARKPKVKLNDRAKEERFQQFRDAYLSQKPDSDPQPSQTVEADSKGDGIPPRTSGQDNPLEGSPSPTGGSEPDKMDKTEKTIPN